MGRSRSRRKKSRQWQPWQYGLLGAGVFLLLLIALLILVPDLRSFVGSRLIYSFGRPSSRSTMGTSCIDTDPQNDVAVPGVINVTYPSGIPDQVADRCQGDTVVQGMCFNGGVVPVHTECANGCAGGVCLGVASPPTTPTTPGKVSCLDTEPANDPTVFGTLTYTNENGISQAHPDACANGANVNQYSCESDNRLLALTTHCGNDSACVEGVCVPFDGVTPPSPVPTPSPVVTNDNARCIAISPVEVEAGSSFTATVTLQNNGTSTWDRETPYRLTFVPRDSQNNKFWGERFYDLPDPSISQGQPGQTVPFTFRAEAPQSPGDYPFAWRMHKKDFGEFGEVCEETITVVAPQGSSALQSRLASACQLAQRECERSDNTPLCLAVNTFCPSE